MKTKLIGLALVVGLGAFAFGPTNGPVYPSVLKFVEPSTATLPAEIPCTAGASLIGITALQETVKCSDESQVTAGSIIHVFCDNTISGSSQWNRAAAYNDYSVASSNQLADSGWMPVMGPTLTVAYPFGRWYPATVGVTCSGGSWDGGVIVTFGGAQQ